MHWAAAAEVVEGLLATSSAARTGILGLSAIPLRFFAGVSVTPSTSESTSMPWGLSSPHKASAKI